LLGFIIREKYKRDGLFKQQILPVIPEIHNELSAGIEYCAVKAHLLTYTVFFYFTAFQAYDPAILRMIRLPLVAAGLAVPFWIVIHNYAAAQADFPGPAVFPHLYTGIAICNRDYIFNG